MNFGADCGPVNAAQKLAQGYQQDRSTQRDQYVNSNGRYPGIHGARGFRSHGSFNNNMQGRPEFVNEINPIPGTSSFQHPTSFQNNNDMVSDWSSAFLQQQQQQQQQQPQNQGSLSGAGLMSGLNNSQAQNPVAHSWASQFEAESQSHRLSHQHKGSQSYQMRYQYPNTQIGFSGRSMMHGPGPAMSSHYVSPMTSAHLAQNTMADSATLSDGKSWADLFEAISHETAQSSSMMEGVQDEPLSKEEHAHSEINDDDLSEAARRLIGGVKDAEIRDSNEVSDETRLKFQNSSFMQLMQQLRDKEVAVEGDKLVQQIKPKGPTVEEPLFREEEGRHNATYFPPGTQEPNIHQGKSNSSMFTSSNNFCLTGIANENELAYAEPLQRASGYLSGLYGDRYSSQQEQLASATAASQQAADQEMLRQQMQSMSLGEGVHAQHTSSTIATNHMPLASEHNPELDDAYAMWNEVAAGDDMTRGTNKSSTYQPLHSGTQSRRYFQGDGGHVVDEDGLTHMDSLSSQENIDGQKADTHIPGASEAWSEDFSMGHVHRMEPLPNLDHIKSLADKFGIPDPEQQQQGNEAMHRESSHMMDDMMTRHDQPSVERESFSLEGIFEESLLPYDRAAMVLERSKPYKHMHREHASASDVSLALERAEASPESAQAWLELGLAYQMNDLDDLALGALNRALELDHSNIKGYLALAVSLGNEHKEIEMLKAFDNLITAFAESNEDYAHTIAQYKKRHGSMNFDNLPFDYLENLLIILLQMHTVNEDDIDANIQMALGILLHASKNYPQALDCFMVNLQLDPDDPEHFNRIGASLSNYGHVDLAIKFFSRAISLSDNFVRARVNLAAAYLRVNDPYRAAAQYTQSLLTLKNTVNDDQTDSVASKWNQLRTAVHITFDSTPQFDVYDKRIIRDALSSENLDVLKKYFTVDKSD